MTPSDQTELKQKLAAIEHGRWADWQKYVHSLMGKQSNGNFYVLAGEYKERWERQIATPYDKLSDVEQASDMEQVDRYWPLIEAYVAAAEQRAVIELVEGLVDAQDQETDLDGRAVGQPYHILCGNDREYLEYVLLPQLKAELEQSLRKEQE